MSVRESRFTAPLSVVDASTATTAVDPTGRRALTMEQYSCDKYDRPPLRAVCRSGRDLPSSACGDGVVDGGDLGLLLAGGGSRDPALDLDGDGNVGGGDLGLLLAAWG